MRQVEDPELKAFADSIPNDAHSYIFKFDKEPDWNDLCLFAITFAKTLEYGAIYYTHNGQPVQERYGEHLFAAPEKEGLIVRGEASKAYNELSEYYLSVVMATGYKGLIVTVYPVEGKSYPEDVADKLFKVLEIIEEEARPENQF